MMHYALLSIVSLIIVFLGWKIWKKTKEPAFILGLALIYYWTLAGAWLIIFDLLTNDKGKDFGVHYYHYREALFTIYLDTSYLLSLLYYGLFIILIQCAVLYFSKNKGLEEEKPQPVFINHKLLIAACIGGAVVSCLLVWKEILIAAKFGESIYIVTRLQPGRFATLHQLINFCIVISLYIGLISYISGKNGKYITGDNSKKILWFYVFCVFLVEGYLLLLGNKREIFFAGIFGALFYFSNVSGKVKWQPIVMLVVIIFTPMLFNDGLRSYSPEWLTRYFDTTGLELHIDQIIEYTEFSVKNSTLAFLFSNEMFSAHFSMYGLVSQHVPFTYGASIWSFVYSLVPKVILPDRPESCYEYYFRSVHALKGQGYTIHHASGWYTNFGVPGVLFGGALLGSLWAWFYNKKQTWWKYKNKFVKLLFVIGLSGFTAQLPSMLRSGPEAYKALIFEALIIPAVIIYFSSLFVKKENKND
jgi:hypothetical protein